MLCQPNYGNTHWPWGNCLGMCAYVQIIAKKHVHSFKLIWMIMFFSQYLDKSNTHSLSVNYLLYKIRLLTINNIKDGVMNIPYKIIHVFKCEYM